jgi:hypothetical protein
MVLIPASLCKRASKRAGLNPIIPVKNQTMINFAADVKKNNYWDPVAEVGQIIT